MKTLFGSAVTRFVAAPLIAAVLVTAGMTLADTVMAVAAETTPASQNRTLGSTEISLESSPSVIAEDGDFDFVVRAKLAEKTQYLQARMRLYMPGGSLVYQKTFIRQSLKPGTARFDFQRTVKDLALQPGTYPAELSIRMLQGEELTETIVPTALRIYDKQRVPAQVAFVARISAQPLSDAQGDFISDPAQFTRARTDAAALAQHVLDNPDARLSLCLSPVMLEEWLRISNGYRFVGAEGEIVAEPEEAVPSAYAETLDVLKRAHATGRLELLSLGYSDPDLNELARAGMLDDVETQYARGKTAAEAALGELFAPGTAPAFGGAPSAAVPLLTRSGIEYMVVETGQLRAGRSRLGSGVYSLDNTAVKVIAARDGDMRSSDGTEPAGLIASLFSSHMATAQRSRQSVLVNVGPGAMRNESLIGLLDMAYRQPWLDVVGVSALATAPATRVARLTPSRRAEIPPHGYWQTVNEARAGAEGLAFAVGTKDPLTARAARSSLIAQSATWQGFDRKWGPAGRGLIYAATAKQLAEQVFEPVNLTARTVTLAGSSGLVPVTIENNGDRPLRVSVTTLPGGNVTVEGPKTRNIDLQPGENFVEIPVRMTNALAGNVRIKLTAAAADISSTNVPVRASYLDRLAIVAAVLVVLGVLLGYIIIRVRSVKSQERSAE